MVSHELLGRLFAASETHSRIKLERLAIIGLKNENLVDHFGFPLALSRSLSLSLSSLFLSMLLIGRAEVIYAGEEGLRGLLTRKQRGIFPGGGSTCHCSIVDYPVAKREAQNS